MRRYGYAPNPRQRNTFMAVVMDTPTADPGGDGMGNYSVHSKYKQPTGARLALGALSTVYGGGQAHTGAVPRSMTGDGRGNVTVVFGGLASGGGDTLEVRHDFGFEVFDTSAGAAGAWVNATVAAVEQRDGGAAVTLTR